MNTIIALHGAAAIAIDQIPDTAETQVPGIHFTARQGPIRAPGRARHFPRDRQIYGEGDDADCIFKVESGVVRTYKHLRDGRRQIYGFHGPGNVFGLEIGKAYGLSAAAASDCTLISYRRRTIETLAAHNERLSSQLLSYAMCSLARTHEHSVSLGRRNAVEKVAVFLIDCTEYSINGRDILLVMSRKDIADYLGLTMETVSRAISNLEHRAFIELNGARQVKLTDMAGLRDLCA